MDVLTPLFPLVEYGAPVIFLIGAVLTRISAVAFLAPGIGERAIPVRVRLVFVFAVTLIVTPLVLRDQPPAPSGVSQILALYAAEAISGLLIGFALRIMVFILQIAGAITAQHLSLAQLFGPNVGFESESPFAAILVMGGVALALAAGLHFHLVGALAKSYEILPFGVFPDAAEAGHWSIRRVGAALTMALALSSPFVILGFIYSLALAASSRAMPQLMAAFVGAPAITLAGLALFAVTAPIMLVEWLAGFDRLMLDVFGSRL